AQGRTRRGRRARPGSARPAARLHQAAARGRARGRSGAPARTPRGVGGQPLHDGRVGGRTPTSTTRGGSSSVGGTAPFVCSDPPCPESTKAGGVRPRRTPPACVRRSVVGVLRPPYSGGSFTPSRAAGVGRRRRADRH